MFGQVIQKQIFFQILFFETEGDFYRLSLQLKELDPLFPTAECYFSDPSLGVIVMENLKLEGYQIGDKTKGKNESGTAS